ncbi:MAG: S-layer homology domain-containing protein [Lutisporaceae bacterium]
MKRLLCAILIISISISSFTMLNAAEPVLKDIGKHWAKDNITYLYNLRYIGGYPDGTYKPNNPVNVAEFLKMATLGIGYKLEGGHFVWYENYVNKALEIGLITEGEFLNLTAPLTREQVAKIAVQAVLHIEEKPSQELDELISMNIRDFVKISDDKKQDVIDAYRMGLMAGNNDGFFNPNDTLTRAEMCTVIMRIMDKAKRQPFNPKSSYAIKMNNIYSGLPYIIARPEKKEEIGLAYVMQDAQSKDLGWYYVSYYPDNFGCDFYNTEQEFKNKSPYEVLTHMAFTIYLDRYGNEISTYVIVVWNPQKAKELHRTPVEEAFKYLFGQDYQKAMALYDKCLDEDLNGTAKPSNANYIIGNRKINVVRDNSSGFTFRIFKKE